MDEIEVAPEQLLEYRRQINESLFAKHDDQTAKLYLTYKGLILKATLDIGSDLWQSIKSFVNKPVWVYDKRLTSHDFGNDSTWNQIEGVPMSAYQFKPDPGMRLTVSSIQVRFPINAQLSSTRRLFFRVYLDRGTGLVPVISLEYSSIFELVKRSNSPIQIQTTILNSVSENQIAEIEFKYADPNSLQGSPINLRSSFGEYLEMGVVENLPVLGIGDISLVDPTWAIVNGKQSLDF